LTQVLSLGKVSTIRGDQHRAGNRQSYRVVKRVKRKGSMNPR